MNSASANSSGNSRTEARFEKNWSTASKKSWKDSPMLALHTGGRLVWPAVDPAAASRAAHEGLPLMNPLSVAALDEAIAVLSLPAGARIVEIGCGDAAILRRIAAASRPAGRSASTSTRS